MTTATAAPKTTTTATTARRSKKAAAAKTAVAAVETTTLEAVEVEADEQLAGVRGASVDQVGDYLRHIGRLSLLTAEEEATSPAASRSGCSPRRSSTPRPASTRSCSASCAGSSATVSAPRSA